MAAFINNGARLINLIQFHAIRHAPRDAGHDDQIGFGRLTERFNRRLGALAAEPCLHRGQMMVTDDTRMMQRLACFMTQFQPTGYRLEFAAHRTYQ